VNELIEFSQGPLFRLTFLILVFGLMRIFILDIWGAIEAYRRAGDKGLAWKAAATKTVEWLFPVKRAFTRRPIYSLISILFHVGMIAVPLFLLAHIQLWKTATGVSWWSMSKGMADVLTLITIASSLALFFGRVLSKTARFLSRKQDYLWPVLLLIPFVTGFICATLGVSPVVYQVVMLAHILSAELIFVLIPFTKIAHCVVMPLSQFIITLAWKFPARIDDKISVTLKKKGAAV